jgi:hypothetical protein
MLNESRSVENDSQESLSESQVSRTSTSTKRRIPQLLSVTSTQNQCFLCKKPDRHRLPKSAQVQAWIEKTILIPHNNRCCPEHLDGKNFSEEALAMIEGKKEGVLLSDDELATWILNMTSHCKKQLGKRRRIDFDNTNNVLASDYNLLLGISKDNFEILR